MSIFKINNEFKPAGDQPKAIEGLVKGIKRSLNHSEWPMPQLIVVDGGVGQLNVARRVTSIPVVAVIKDDKHKVREILELGQHSVLAKEILLANAEAHRFAITYHRKLRSKGFRL